jgi:DNA primase
MDAIALQTAGFEQAVATLGTGFTPGHVRLLKRFTEAVVVNFDPDAAGRQATRRSLETLLENGFEVRVVALPQGKDPDRFVRDEGAEGYRAQLQSALPYVEYLARETAGRIDVRAANGKVKALNEVLPFVARIDHPVRRASQVEMLASVFGIEDRLVLQELKDAVRDRKRGVRAPAAGTAGKRTESVPEAYLVRALLDDGAVRRALLPEIDGQEFGSQSVREIVNAVRRLEGAGEEVTWPRIGSEVSDGAREALMVIAAAPQPAPSVDAGRACLRTLHREKILKQMAELQKEIQTRQAAGHAADELSLRKQALNRQIEALRGASA